ncbi:MAG: cell division protein [Alphaproteobacteria bacterium]|nr:cell division protein [Alphaproteobacteria bacterium]
MSLVRRRTDLPTTSDATSRFVPLLIALMVFLAVMALSGLMVLHGLAGRWERDIRGTLTVQVPAVISGPEAEARSHAKVEAALNILSDTRGVLHAEPLGRDRIISLLEPWLGSADLIAELPLPRLIDVTTDPHIAIDIKALAARLEAVQPGATVEDHRIWLGRLLRLTRSVEMLAVLVLGLVGVITSATVIFATRTGMAIHHQVIEVLHLIGAQDDYIARQFARRTFLMGLKGGVIGLGLGIGAIFSFGFMARSLEGGVLPEFWLTPAHWLAVVSLPLAAAWIATLTARIAVLRALARMT